MTLALTNISTAVVKTALSESVDNVKDLCDSTAINEWALHKAANYGVGKGAWSVDTGEYSGFAKPIGVATGPYRLGDFRGYNHDEFPPKYFNVASYSYYKYEPPDGTIVLRGGAMYSTTNDSGFNPTFHVLDEGASDSLTGVRAEVDGTPFGDTYEIDQIQALINITGFTQSAGSYTLTAYYYTRPTDVSAWTKDNEIEGGSVALTVTELPAKFIINSRSIAPDEVPTAGTEDFVYSYQIENLVAGSTDIKLYWELADQSGSSDFTLTSLEVDDRTINITAADIPEEGAMFRLYWDLSGGAEIDNSNAGVIVAAP